MFFVKIFERKSVSGIARRDVRKIVAKIKRRFWAVRFVIWLIANAAPVRDFWKRKSVRKETAITSVLIEPIRIRNCLLESLPVISEPMIAAWDEPKPGRSEQIGEVRIVARVGLKSSDFCNFSFSIFCCGGIVFWLIEWIMVEVPKSPVRRGRSGVEVVEFREAIPRMPARVKIRIAEGKDFFSFESRKMLVQIRMKPIICWIML